MMGKAGFTNELDVAAAEVMAHTAEGKDRGGSAPGINTQRKSARGCGEVAAGARAGQSRYRHRRLTTGPGGLYVHLGQSALTHDHVLVLDRKPGFLADPENSGFL